MNIQGYGSGSFVDIMNSSHKRNQIPLVNQIVSYKDTEDGEIYRAYFTEDRITTHNAVGQKAWETEIKDASHAQKIKESLGGITLYSQDKSNLYGAVNGVNEESVTDVLDMTDKKDFLSMIYDYMQMQYDANNLEGYLSLKSLYDCMTGGKEYEC